MPLFLHLCIVWLQRRPAWSNSRAAWLERAAGAVVLTAAATVWWLGKSLSSSVQAVLGAALVVGTAVLLRRGWLTLFGPVLFYDMVLTARRRRHAVLRCLYALALVYTVVIVYLVSMATESVPRELLDNPLAIHRLPPHVIQDLSARFFLWFAAIQMAAAVLLTPAYVAGAVAAERERQTLDALLGTDLRNREIVLSLLVSRLANLALILLTGLPILSLLEFLGGLDPNLVLASFVATGLTMTSLGCLGIFHSVRTAKPRTAILRTYLWAFLYLSLSGLSWLLLLPTLNFSSFPSTPTWDSPVTVEDVVGWLNAGNPVAAVVRLTNDLEAGGSLDKLLPNALRTYAWFHGFVAVVCLVWAVARFRICVLRDAQDSARGEGTASRRQGLPGLVEGMFRSRVVAWPLLWKELIVDTGGRRGWFGWFGVGLFVAVGFFPVAHLVFWRGGFVLSEFWWEGMKEPIHWWVRGMSGLVGSLMLVQVGVRAAAAVSGERARQTLDSLLTTPLEVGSILFAKWLGAILSPRWAWVWLGLIWAVGLLTQAVRPAGPFRFVGAWLVYAAFMAGLGLYFSGTGRTTQRATVWTLLTAFLVLAVSWLLAFDLSPAKYEGYGLIPPVALALLPTAYAGFDDMAKAEFAQPFSINLGLILWAVLAVFLGMLATHRFRFLTGRLYRRHRLEKEQPALSNPIPVPLTTTIALVGEIEPAPPNAPPTTGEPLSTPVSAAPAATVHRPRRWFGRSEEGQRPSSPRVRRPWRQRLRPLVPLLLPSVLLLGWYTVDAMSAYRQLGMASAEADRLDPGWRLEELDAHRTPLPDDRNSVLIVESADRLFPKPMAQDDWPLRRTEMILFETAIRPQARLHEKQVQVLTQDLHDCRAALAEARKLAAYPDGWSQVAWSRDFVSTFFPYLDRCQRIANLLGYDVTLRAHQKDQDGALISCRALLHVGRSIGDMPNFCAQAARDRMRSLAVRRVERTLAQGEASALALAEIQLVLEREAKEPLSLYAARLERAEMDRVMDAAQRGDLKLSQAFGLFVAGRPGGRSQDLEVLFSGNLTSQRAALLRYQTQMVEIIKLPLERHAASLQTLQNTVSSEPLLVMAWGNPYERSLNFQKTTAELRCAAVMAAVERFRLKYQRWPESLAKLMPEFLTRVPLDPCTGLPLLYRRLPDGVVIYSVGSDGQDNGGNINHHPMLGALRVAGFDWGVRLWDVPRRRQEPGVRDLPDVPELGMPGLGEEKP